MNDVLVASDQALELGKAAYMQNRFEAAGAHFREALGLYRQIGNVLGEANALQGLGEIEGVLGRHEAALKLFSEAQRLHKQIGNVMGEANALQGLGQIERMLDRNEAARSHFSEAQRLHKQIANVLGEANAMQGLGRIERALGRHEAARSHFSEAQRLHKQIGSVLGEANALDGLGQNERALGRNEAARTHFSEAQRLHKQIGNLLGEANALDGLGEIERALGRNEAARTHFSEAQRLHKQVGNVLGEANAMQGLGEIEGALGRNEAARTHFSEAQRLHKQIANVLGEANALKGLGRVEAAVGLNEAARTHFSEAQRLHKQIGSALGEANALYELANLERSCDRENLAREHYRDAAILFGLCGQHESQARAQALATGTWAKTGAKSKYWLIGRGLLVGLLLGVTTYVFLDWNRPQFLYANTTFPAWHVVAEPTSDTAIVFVHGILSGPESAWGKWPEVLNADTRVRDALGGAPDIFLAHYYTAVDSGNYKIEDAADALRTQLRTPIKGGQQPVLSRKRIIFIAHSMGGIVVRDVLERYRDDFAGKTIGLVLMASPSRGSEWSDRLELLTKVGNNKMAQQLATTNDYVANLDKRFSDFVNKTPYTLTGLDVFEQKFEIPNRWLGMVLPFPRVVEPKAQSYYFGSAKIAANTDHSSVVKPQDASHPSHAYLVDYLTHTFGKAR